MELIYKYKRYFLLAGMATCLVAMIATINPNFRPVLIIRAFGYIVVPLQRTATSATDWIGSRASLLWEMNQLQMENQRLRDEIGWLQIENQRLQLAGEEYLHLTELLDVRQRYIELPQKGAIIIAQEPNPWYRRFVVDRGSNDGLEPWMPVLAPGGLAGRIFNVSPNSSQVLSLLDDHFRVMVQSVRTEDTGMVKGDSTLMQQGLARMDYISLTAQIMVGDEIVTAAISDVFPPGIRVGTVQEVRPAPDGLSQYAIIRPGVNFNRLRHVSIVNELFYQEGQTE